MEKIDRCPFVLPFSTFPLKFPTLQLKRIVEKRLSIAIRNKYLDMGESHPAPIVPYVETIWRVCSFPSNSRHPQTKPKKIKKKIGLKSEQSPASGFCPRIPYKVSFLIIFLSFWPEICQNPLKCIICKLFQVSQSCLYKR